MCDDRAALRRIAATAAARADKLGRPVLASWTTTVPDAGDPVERWARARAGTDRAFFWSSPWSGRKVVAVGSAADLTGHGPGRFARVRRHWAALCRDAVAPDPASLALLGGFAFRGHGTDRDGAGTHRDGEGRHHGPRGADRHGHGSGAARLPDALLWVPAGILVELLPPNMFNVGIGRRIAGPGFIEKALEILDLKSLRFGPKAVSPRPAPVQAARERRADDEPRQRAARHSLARRRSCPHCHSHNTELMDQGRVRCHACRTVSKLPPVPEAENYADETA